MKFAGWKSRSVGTNKSVGGSVSCKILLVEGEDRESLSSHFLILYLILDRKFLFNGTYSGTKGQMTSLKTLVGVCMVVFLMRSTIKCNLFLVS
jgi:hypothetical protein